MLPRLHDDVCLNHPLHAPWRIHTCTQEIAFKLRIPQRKPWASMATDVADALKVAQDPKRVRLFSVVVNVHYVVCSVFCLSVCLSCICTLMRRFQA